MEREIKLETDKLALQIKYLAALEGLTVKRAKELVNKKFGKHDSNNNLSNKLRNKTFRVTELAEILDILNYEIILRKKS